MTHEDSAAVWDGDDDVNDGQGRGSLVRRITKFQYDIVRYSQPCCDTARMLHHAMENLILN